jgi:hypothetical protein
MSLLTPLYASLIDSIAAFYQAGRQQRYKILAELIPAIAENAVASRARNRATSCDLNVFRFFNPGETTHSRVLAFFLDPQARHGQGNLFLAEFLRLLGISDPDTGQWIVTAEVGRVDVLLKRSHPHSVVVIENKSNYAGDQPNQLYRYWYQEIYQKQRAQHRSEDEIAHPPPAYYWLVYLSPSAWKQADAQSLRKPGYLPAHLPAVVPMQAELHLFGGLVVQWLKNTLDRLPPTNHRLREFVLQYLQFWEVN